ncbi:TrbC family F-type conjugative pilus assembly protein [Methylomonas sp. AM2-LC]|uniref:TrbC family F-type conjugative pilus assembly protein n=1 Tax=Methylomonas sp. AM2-LC TaxID=3153301 RepID=UPI00326739A1
MGFQCTVYAEEDWLTHSHQILKNLEGQSRPAWLDNNPNTADAKREAMELMKGSGSVLPFDKQSAIQKAANTSKPLTVMFISFSQGEVALKGIFQEVSGRDDVLLVLRGPKPQQKLPQLFAELKPLLKGIDPVPNIVFDPTRFQKYGVTSVPEIVIESSGKVRLQVKGVTSLDWVKAQLDQNKQGDLGRFGEIYDIAEVDMLQEMKTRLASIDWKLKKQQALARFWQKREFEVLPKATEDHEHIVDLTVAAPRDLSAPNGNLIVRAGQTVNPLDKMAFGLCLLVFDGTVPAQIERVKSLSCQDGKARRMYLATQLPRQDGWEALKTLETSLNSPVYLLTPDVRQRFQLQNVPALIEQSGNRVVVRERKVSCSVGAAS